MHSKDFLQFQRLECETRPQLKAKVSASDLHELVQIITKKDQIVSELLRLKFEIQDRTEIDGTVRVHGDETLRPILSNFDLNGLPFLLRRPDTGQPFYWELPLRQIDFFKKF